MLIRIACVCAVVAAYASTADYRHEAEQAEHYNEMVCEGHWPDYRNREPVCPGDPVQPWDAYEPPPRQ